MMFNYKKSLLSVATATALAVTSVSANYIPLADTSGAGERWTLFGVTGLKTSGAGAGTSAGTFSIADSVTTKAEDATLDELFTEGMTISGNSLAKVKVYSPYATVDVRVDTTDMVFNETEPVRTMYVTMTEGGGPSFAFSYRASMEGETMQYSVNADGSDAHTITISSEYTYNNPGLGETIQEIAGIDGSSLSALSDMVDYNLENNPSDSAYYDQDEHQDVAGATDYLRVYSYDAATESWLLYDSRNTADANDFASLEKGKAYWAKMSNPANSGGLVLGSASISAAEYTTAGIQDGWNLMAFDNTNPFIRKSETGLLLGGIAIGATYTIYDSSGNHSVQVTGAATAAADVLAINNAISQGKLDGDLPDTFELRAYEIDEPGGTYLYALISNKRFFIEDDSDAAITNIATLTGANPYLVTDPANPIDGDDTTTVADLGATGDVGPNNEDIAMSKYGEYGMVIEPLVGDAGGAPWDTAAAMAVDAARVHVQSAASDATTVSAISIDETAAAGAALTATVADLGSGVTGVDIGGENAYAFEIDSDGDGTNDKILMASREPFYVRDHTFTRVFEYTSDADDTDVLGDITVSGTGSDSTYSTLLADTTAAALALALKGDANNAQATEDTTGDKLIIVSASDDANEFLVTEDTSSTVNVDELEDSTTAEDVAKGAIKGVYSLTSFASVATTNIITIDIDQVHDEATDTVGFTYDDARGTTYTIAEASLSQAYNDTVDGDVVDYMDELIALLNASFTTNLIDATATHNVTSAATLGAGLITISGPDVVTATFETTDAGGAGLGSDTALLDTASVDSLGEIETISADLADDLKFNAVYTPNYVSDGPLYSMKETGFTLKAMVTGTTDLTDGTVNWDSLDLTRKPSEWLDSQEYNLFKIDETSGYWSYLETDSGTNDLTVSNAVISPIVYTYRINANGTNYSSVSGNVALTIAGLNDYDDRKSAVINVTIAGSTVELANIAGSDVYNGKMSSYEIETMTTGYNYEVLANIADGLGYNQKSLDVDLTIDMQKPTAPTIDLGDGTAVAFTSTSTDAAGYYVYNGQIAEENTGDYLVSLTSAEAASYALCPSVPKLAWDGDIYNLNVIAVDGTGVLGKGNISDTTTQNYVPMLKDAVRLEDVSSGDSDATIFGKIYDANCAETGDQTVNYGVTLTSETDLQTVTMAYEPLNVSDLTAVPITLFVNATDADSSVVAKITYDTAYAGDSVYIQLESTVYSLELPTLAEITAYGDGTDSTDPLDLSDAATNSAKQTDQSL